MNTKFLKAVTAIAFAVVASSQLGQAAALSTSEFKAELAAKIGTKKELSAANAAAKYFGSVLKSKENKKNADKYAKLLITALKKTSLKGAFAGASVNACYKQALTGYFAGLKFNLNDKTFTKVTNTLFKGLPPTARTVATSQTLYNSLKTFALKKGSTQDQVFTYYQGETAKFNLPPPIS